MKRTRMKAVSDRRRKRDAGYQKARAAVFERENEQCQVLGPDCTWQATDVHHIAGRVGPDPHRLDNLLAACATCHATVHKWPEWARAHGWMRTRLGGAA